MNLLEEDLDEDEEPLNPMTEVSPLISTTVLCTWVHAETLHLLTKSTSRN